MADIGTLIGIIIGLIITAVVVTYVAAGRMEQRDRAADAERVRRREGHRPGVG